MIKSIKFGSDYVCFNEDRKKIMLNPFFPESDHSQHNLTYPPLIDGCYFK